MEATGPDTEGAVALGSVTKPLTNLPLPPSPVRTLFRSFLEAYTAKPMLCSYMTLHFSYPPFLFSAEKHGYLGILPGISLPEQHLYILFFTVAKVLCIYNPLPFLFLKQSCFPPHPHPSETWSGQGGPKTADLIGYEGCLFLVSS